MVNKININVSDIWKSVNKKSDKLWRELQKATPDSNVTYVLDFKSVDIGKRLNSKACTNLVCKPNVKFKVYDQNLEVLLNVAIMANVPDYSLSSRRVMFVQDSTEVLEAVEVNLVNIERINSIKVTFMHIDGDVCTIRYPYPIEVDEDMMCCIRDTIENVAFDKEHSNITKFVVSINTANMNRGARVHLWNMLNKSGTVMFNNKEINFDISAIKNETLRYDLEMMFRMKHLDISKEERDLYFSYKLPIGTVGLFTKYQRRTRGHGNQDNVVYRHDSEIAVSRIGIYNGVEYDGNYKYACFITLDAAQDKDMCITEEEFQQKYNDATLKRPKIKTIEEKVRLIDIGYDTEFIGNYIEFLRFDPHGTVDTIINGKPAVVSDAVYAKMILDSYNLDYNRDELENDIRRSEV